MPQCKAVLDCSMWMLLAGSVHRLTVKLHRDKQAVCSLHKLT